MKILTIRIPRELKVALGVLAKKKGVSMTCILLMLIEDYVVEETRKDWDLGAKGGLKESN